MGLIKTLDGFLDSVGLFSYTDLEISQIVEDRLNKENFEGTFYFVGKETPLFVNSNWETIENKILNNDGKLKLAVCEKPKLPNFLLKNLNNLKNIEIYKINKSVNYSSALFYDTFEIWSNPKKPQFYLNHFVSQNRIRNYKLLFEDSKNELTKIDTRSCFSLKPIN